MKYYKGIKPFLCHRAAHRSSHGEVYTESASASHDKACITNSRTSTLTSENNLFNFWFYLDEINTKYANLSQGIGVSNEQILKTYKYGLCKILEF